MQTIQFLETVKWLEALIKGPPSEVFGRMEEIWRDMRVKDGARRDEPRELLLQASHHIAQIQPEIRSHAFAERVLQAFGLSDLLSREFALQIARSAISTSEGSDDISGLYNFSLKWQKFIACAGPIEKITTPSEVVEQSDFDDILTIELRLGKDESPSAKTLSTTLKYVNELYTDISHLSGKKNPPRLTTIYAASGSSFRFDFTGAGDIIKELKKLLVELWDKVRHADGERLRHTNKTILSTLKTLEQIKATRVKQAITDEDADKLAVKILRSANALFKDGALPREIPAVEAVQNQQLMDGIRQKFLPAPAAETTKEKKQGKKKAKHVKSKAKSSKKSADPPKALPKPDTPDITE